MEQSNAATRDAIALTHGELSDVQRDNTLLVCENSALHEGHQSQLQVTSSKSSVNMIVTPKFMLQLLMKSE